MRTLYPFTHQREFSTVLNPKSYSHNFCSFKLCIPIGRHAPTTVTANAFRAPKMKLDFVKMIVMLATKRCVGANHAPITKVLKMTAAMIPLLLTMLLVVIKEIKITHVGIWVRTCVNGTYRSNVLRHFFKLNCPVIKCD